MYFYVLMYTVTFGDEFMGGTVYPDSHNVVSRKPFGEPLYNCEENIYHCKLAVCNYFVQYVSE
jgi:hypothetical protein